MNAWKNIFVHSALSNLQIITGGCYLALIFLTVPKENAKVDPTSMITIFIVHITSFFNTAIFSLVWCITPETFPKHYRYILSIKVPNLMPSTYMFMNLN